MPVDSMHSVPADFIKNAILLVGGILGIAALIRGMFWPARRDITPQPLQVAPAPEWVSKADCVTKETQMRERMARLEAIVDQIRLEAKNDRASIVEQLHALELRLIADGERRDRNTQARINDLLASVSKVIGHIETSPTPTV